MNPKIYSFRTELDLCQQEYKKHLQLIKLDNFDRFILAGHWLLLSSGQFSESGVNWRLAEIPKEEQISSLISNLQILLEAIGPEKEIIIVLQIPELNFDIETCFETTIADKLFGVKKNCSIEYEQHIFRTKIINELFSKRLNTFPNVKFFNPAMVLCDGKLCNATDGVLPYYTDGDHLNQIGAKYLMQEMKLLDFKNKTHNF